MNTPLLIAGYFAGDLNTLVYIIGYLLCGIIGLLGIAVLWAIYTGQIDLSQLISENNGDASMSRFQFLIFTFVIALSLFLVIVAGKNGDGKPAFPDTIPGGILTLLGISGSSYAVGKAIQFSDPAGIDDRPVTVTISPGTATVKFGQQQQFGATVTRQPDARVKWTITAGPTTGTDDEKATIDATGLFTAPKKASVPPAQHATIQASLVDFPGVTDVAVVTFVS